MRIEGKLVRKIVLGIAAFVLFGFAVRTYGAALLDRYLAFNTVRVDFEYPILLKTVFIGSREFVTSVCGATAGRWDDGSDIIDPSDIGACYSESRQTILLSYDNPEALIHELCHAGGYSSGECSKVHWPSNKAHWPSKVILRIPEPKEVPIDKN